MVAPLCATVSHQVPGWKRSSCTMQPPLRIIAIDEHASAFMWTSGSGVISRSAPGSIRHRPPRALYQRPNASM
ncbi:hypothetical protein D3C81_639840 [compost metagenome]